MRGVVRDDGFGEGEIMVDERENKGLFVARSRQLDF
jgi:hypothetical protein